jgi:hypothetical protein
LPQPGAATNAVLAETDRAWLLIFAMLLLTLTLVSGEHATILSLIFGGTVAFAYGLLADFSDLLFGFWGTAGLILLPILLALAFMVVRRAPAPTSRRIAFQLVLFGLVYPCVAGFDPDRQPLYLNICSLLFLLLLAPLLLKRNDAATAPIATIRAATT